MRLDYSEPIVQLALTHPSYANERGLSDDNQRLEFLGDAVLGLAISQALFRSYGFPEGELTRWRAALVREPSLAAWAGRLGLGEQLRLGRGEELTGGRRRPSVLADAMEALIGAIFLHYGYDTCAEFVREGLSEELKALEQGLVVDAKTALQEVCQAQGRTLAYHLESQDGPPHARRFTVQAIVSGQPLARGTGRSKKEAEQSAATAALLALTKETQKPDDTGDHLG